jgi:hypothetical protein
VSRSAPHSRLPFTNRADPQNGRDEAATVRMAKQPESGKGRKLREEVTWDSIGGVEAVTWNEATERFRSWYSDQRETEIVVENELGETAAFRTPNRFTPDYREMLYAKAQALERGLRERWGKLLHTGMITLSATSTDSEGNPRPPVEHLEDLLSSWEAVRRALSRVLDGRDWEYLAIIEPHESGYAHIHLGVFVKGPVVREQFRPVIDAHLRNSDGAGREAHEITDGEDSAVSVHRTTHPSRESGVENLGAYLAAYMAGEYGVEATEMPAHVQRFYATMWATGRQWFRPSNGAQELMQPAEEESDPDEWSVVGIAPDGEPEEEIIEIDPATTGGVPYRRLRRDREMPEADVPEVEDDPPPDWGGLSRDSGRGRRASPRSPDFDALREE